MCKTSASELIIYITLANAHEHANTTGLLTPVMSPIAAGSTNSFGRSSGAVNRYGRDIFAEAATSCQWLIE